MRKPKSFARALTISQVGAEPLKTKRGTVYKLGGGLFSQKQILASRQRFTRTMGLKIKKKSFGL